MNMEEFRRAVTKVRTVEDADRLWAKISIVSPNNLKQRQELAKLLTTTCKQKGIPGIKGGYE